MSCLIYLQHKHGSPPASLPPNSPESLTHVVRLMKFFRFWMKTGVKLRRKRKKKKMIRDMGKWWLQLRTKCNVPCCGRTLVFWSAFNCYCSTEWGLTSVGPRSVWEMDDPALPLANCLDPCFLWAQLHRVVTKADIYLPIVSRKFPKNQSCHLLPLLENRVLLFLRGMSKCKNTGVFFCLSWRTVMVSKVAEPTHVTM